MPSAEYMKQYRAERKLEQKVSAPYTEQDAAGIRHKSEVLSYYELNLLFLGLKKDAPTAEDSEDDSGKKKTYRKRNIVAPVKHKFFGLNITFEQWLELRDRARKDLFWLGRDMLHKGLVPTTHNATCEQFVQKNFDGCFSAGYTIDNVHSAIAKQFRTDENQQSTREMMLLDARGFYKSTIDGIDCVQWMLNVPDIRILILTGEYKLAVAFMKEIKGYFFLADGADPSDFHCLFPEYILVGVDGASREPILCPARLRSQKEPSLWVNSIDANLSGWHCDIRKMDDIVTDENSNNVDTRKALKLKADGTENLVDEWGFTDYIGTRYFVDDYYGTRMKPEESDAEVSPLKYFCRACWIVKPEYVDVPLRHLKEDMVILTFPEKATFKSLRSKLLKNERSFRNQQLNQPTATDEDSLFKISFDEDTLRAHTYSPSAAPREGDIIVCWDWAASANKQSDYSAGAAGRIYKKVVRNEILGMDEIVWGICVLDVVFDKWKPSELAYQVVAFDKKWHPKQTLIERSTGAELLQMEVQRNAVKFGVTMNVYWKPVDQSPDAKRNRIKGIETLLKSGQFWMVTGAWNDMAYKQLCDYTGERKNRGRKDDIPDAMSFLTFFLPMTGTSEERKKIEEAQSKVAMQRANYDRIFGNGPVNLSHRPAPVEPVAVPRVIDPRQRFFGGNGMHA
jgi:phage terminase large subunit-like protein